MGCVYKLTINRGEEKSSKSYIGQTINDLNLRLANHKSCKSNPHLPISRAINKYGWNNVEVEVIFESEDIEQLNEKEIYYIEKFETRNQERGYNIREGGKNSPLTKEMIENISRKHRGDKSRFAKLTWEQVNEVRQLYNYSDISSIELSKIYNMSVSAITSIINNIAWYDDKYERIQTKKVRKGENNSHSRLTLEQVNEIRNLYFKGIYTLTYLAKKYNINRNHVTKILKNERWHDENYIFDEEKFFEIEKSKMLMCNSGIDNKSRKLNLEQIKQIRELYKTKQYSHRKLAKIFNVTKSNIGNIVNNKTWKDEEYGKSIKES